MTKAEQARLVAWRLKILQYAESEHRHVAQTCRYFGISRTAFYRTTSDSLGGTHQVIRKGTPKGPLFYYWRARQDWTAATPPRRRFAPPIKPKVRICWEAGWRYVHCNCSSLHKREALSYTKLAQSPQFECVAYRQHAR